MHGQTSYVGNFTVGGVRKIRSAKLHQPPTVAVSGIL